MRQKYKLFDKVDHLIVTVIPGVHFRRLEQIIHVCHWAIMRTCVSYIPTTTVIETAELVFAITRFLVLHAHMALFYGAW